MSPIQLRRPETQLLLQCARTSRSREATDWLRDLVQEGLDWDHLLSMAYRHGMGSLLYWHLDATRSAAIPRSTLANLRNHFRGITRRNLFLTGELLRILSIFSSHGIPAIPFKGPVLAASAYGNLALREFGDLDILVKRQHVQEAKEVLVCMGYRQVPPYYNTEHSLTQAQEAAYIRSLGQRTFTRDDGRSVVELHWEVVPRGYCFPLDTERLWERLNRTLLGGTIVPDLSPEDMLLILCVHGYKHLWSQLGWICDVAELVRSHQDLAWEQVMAEARALGGERMLLIALFLADDLLGATLPKRVQQKAWADPTVKVVAERIYERLFPQAAIPAGQFHAYWLHLKMRERLLDKVRYCAYKAATPTVEDWKLVTLPDSMFSFYYVLRPIRLTGKYGSTILKRIS